MFSKHLDCKEIEVPKLWCSLYQVIYIDEDRPDTDPKLHLETIKKLFAPCIEKAEKYSYSVSFSHKPVPDNGNANTYYMKVLWPAGYGQEQHKHDVNCFVNDTLTDIWWAKDTDITPEPLKQPALNNSKLSAEIVETSTTPTPRR